MPDLARLNYAPLTDRPSKPEVVAFREAREVLGYDESAGFDEQKAPATSGKPDAELWERRYRLAAFADANGMTYVFRSDPSRWPGSVASDTVFHDVLEGTDTDGRRVMACAQDITRKKGAVNARTISFDNYTVLGLQLGAKTPSVYFKHTWRTHLDAADLLDANYTADDPYAVSWAPRDKEEHFASAKPWLTREVLEIVLKQAPDHDLFLSGGWLYLMKPFDYAAIEKKNADPALLRARFELAAQLAPVLAATAANLGAGGYDADAEARRRAQQRQPSKQDQETDRRARAFAEKLMAEDRSKNSGGDRA